MDRLISEQEVLDVIASWFESTEQQRILQGRIKAIPSAESKTGHWIMKHRNINKIEYHTGEDILNDEIHTVKELIRYETDDPYCSECGKRTDDIAQDFCGYCGADMRGDDNEDND